ncbi:MAG TPA: glycerophosphodiester phosphodiesterase family protein [Beijerinckiaceae bacterium]|nr:glycerophosphodiester phosphodiesterase family protein [Beijerinckiaceae bacterium]
MNLLAALAEIFRRPIAHRGLHEAAQGAVENSASAAQRAIARGLAIECDVQLSADGEAMVFHDFTLERLTGANGRVDALPARQLEQISLGGGEDRLMTFAAFLELVRGRAPVICEIKSRFDGDMRLGARAAAIASSAPGLVALESFDPEVIAHLRAQAYALAILHVPLGIVAMADFADADCPNLSVRRKQELDAFLHWERTRPDFLAYRVDDLPHAAPYLCRAALNMPVMAWTVRTREQAAVGRAFADQLVFENDVL